MHQISIDIETYSDLPIGDVGLFRYADSPAFRVLLIAAAVDDGPVQVIDVERATEGARKAMLDDLLQWLARDDVTLHAFNAVFEWYCLGRAGIHTPLEKWRCTMVHGLYLGYTGGLDAMGSAVGLEADKRKLATGKALIRRFGVPDAAGHRVRPEQEPEQWRLFQEYNRGDVEAERALERRFAPWPLPEREQALWVQDIRMNEAGVRVDRALVRAARALWADEKQELLREAAHISGLSNPNSPAQLKAWLARELGAPVSIRKDGVQELLDDDATPDVARRVLEVRQRLGKTSVTKFDALAEMTTEKNPRVRGLLQFYGAHTGRWSGRGIQVHNLPKPTLSADALAFARRLLTEGAQDPTTARTAINLCFGSLPDTLSQLIRTMLMMARTSWRNRRDLLGEARRATHAANAGAGGRRARAHRQGAAARHERADGRYPPNRRTLRPLLRSDT